MKSSRDILRIRVPYGQVSRMGRRRLFFSPSLFGNLVEDLWSTNKGLFWSNSTFGEVRGRCRFGGVNESRSHSANCARFGFPFRLQVL